MTQKKRMKKIDTFDLVFDLTNKLLLLLLAASIIIPFLSLLALSLSTPGDSARLGMRLIPKTFTLSSYVKVFENRFIWLGYRNTLVRVVLGTSISVVATCFAAYPLSKLYLPGRKGFTMYFIMNMFFTGGLIPTFLLVRGLGITNSVWALVLPAMVGTYTLLVVRNSFMMIPDSIEESAKIDGANDFSILLRIIVPMSGPIIATISLWYAVAHWNNWFDSMLYITNSEKHVLQFVLRKIVIEGKDDLLNQYDTTLQASPQSLKAASIYVATLPILCVYPFIQKYFVTGITVGAVKG